MDTDAFMNSLKAAVLQPTREAFVQLHRDLNAIEFSLLVDRSAWTPSIPKPLVVEPKCAAPGCNDTLRTPGGLYLVGDNWLCPTHCPPLSYNETQPDGSTIVRQRQPPVGWVKADVPKTPNE